MSLPSQKQTAPHRAQASIRSFFKPKQPVYAAPPSAAHQLKQQTQPAEPPPAAPPLPKQHTNGQQETATPVPIPAPKPTHHPNITISPILPSHIPSLRRITSRLLPVRYPDSFYAALSDPSSSGAFSRVLLYTDDAPSTASNSFAALSSPSKPTVIGGLVCRPETTFQARPHSPVDVIPNALYIQSLVLNEPYRHLGLAKALLDEVCSLAAADERWNCRTVCAHVWIENPEGMEWYLARGFTRVEPVVEAYYRQLKPDAAWIVRRDISGPATRGSVMEAMAQSQAAPGVITTAPPPLAAMSATRPGPKSSPASGVSYQDRRPETEWNDLPPDMASGLTVPGSGRTSGASSRSSSRGPRKKRDRAYPAAAFN